MKWFYALFFAAAVVILSGSLYLIFGQKKADVPLSSAERIYESQQKAINEESLWGKVAEYKEKYPGVR